MTLLTQEMSELAPAFYVVSDILTIPAGAGGVQLCQANPLRWGLVLAWCNTAGATNNVLGVSVEPNVRSGEGLLIQPGSPFSLNYRASPGLTTSAWYGSATIGAPATVFVLEELAQQ